MGRIYADNSLSIGNTPLVKLNRIVDQNGATVLGKVEGRNPSYSIKCRIGASMVWDAEKRGALKPGKEIIEPTSGNTGIGLAYVAAARNYPITIVMPEHMSIERRRILKAFGANVILTPAAEGMKGAIARATEISESDPDRYFMPQQFTNPANPKIHEETTGPEIWKDTDGAVDAVVAGVGTGGTITGIARYLKRVAGKQVTIIAVEPETSAVLSQHMNQQPPQPGQHQIQGIGAGFIPDVLDMDILDRVETVSDNEAFEYTRRLAREEGILSGISSGATVAVSARLAKQEAFHGKTIVAILADAGERYLSGKLFD